MMYMYLFDKKDQNITIFVRVLFTWLVISKFKIFTKERERGGGLNIMFAARPQPWPWG